MQFTQSTFRHFYPVKKTWKCTWLKPIYFKKGTRSISKHFSLPSPQLPNMTVEVEVKIEIDRPIDDEFLQKHNRIMTIRVLHAGAIPDSWVGNNYTASIPIPKGKFNRLMRKWTIYPHGSSEVLWTLKKWNIVQRDYRRFMPHLLIIQKSWV